MAVKLTPSLKGVGALSEANTHGLSSDGSFAVGYRGACASTFA
jgi:hypothetical protein